MLAKAASAKIANPIAPNRLRQEIAFERAASISSGTSSEKLAVREEADHEEDRGRQKRCCRDDPDDPLPPVRSVVLRECECEDRQIERYPSG